MSFQKTIRLPLDRIGVLIGKNGSVKKRIEDICGISILIDSKTGEVTIDLKKDIQESEPFKAIEIINAIGRGFSPSRAFKLLQENVILEILDLREYTKKSHNSLERVKGRIIGFKGKCRNTLEELTNTFISVFGHTVGIIGKSEEVKSALDAIDMLASGSIHKTVYNMLQRERRKNKMDRMKLWEEY